MLDYISNSGLFFSDFHISYVDLYLVYRVIENLPASTYEVLYFLTSISS